MTTTFASIEELARRRRARPRHDRLDSTISQDRIDQFADATEDHQWIHVDVERAKSGPFGGTIAHGYLTLSLCALLPRAARDRRAASRWASTTGSTRRGSSPRSPPARRVRGRGEVVSVTEVAGGVQAVVRITVELEGSEKPAAVVDTVSRYLV